MAKTYAEILKEIARLEAQAAASRKGEIPGVISRIKEAIAHYGLSAADLGFTTGAIAHKASVVDNKKAAGPAGASKGASKTPAGTGGKPMVKYRGAAGQTWSGMGPKPGWLRAAMEAGQSLESLAVQTPGAAGVAAKGTKAAAAPQPKSPSAAPSTSTAKYRGPSGQTWSGRGPMPGWLRAEVGKGIRLEDMAV